MIDDPGTFVAADDLGFVEGPVVIGPTELFVTSIDRGILWHLRDSHAKPMATVGGGPNGLCLGARSKLYVAQSGVVAPEHPNTGSASGVQVVDVDTGAVGWVSQELDAPNDLCFGPNGALYVTDPTRPHYADDGRPIWPRDSRIWRVDPSTGDASALTVPWYANGIGIGLESHLLYVAASDEQRIYTCRIRDDGALDPPELHIQMTRGHPDGFAFDDSGNLIVAAIALKYEGVPGEVQRWSPRGELLDTWVPGDGRLYTNVALTSRGRAYVTDSTYGRVLYSDRWQGSPALPLYPFR